MKNITSRVQVYFIEKFVVAQSPKRDYYGLRVSNNQLSLITWKVAHGPHRLPLERKISLQDFATNRNFQDEIFRTFGEETLSQVLEVILGNKDYLQRLPPVLLSHILVNLDSKDITHFSEASELCRKAVKNTMSLLDVHQNSFKSIRLRKQLLGQSKPHKSTSSRMLSISNECITTPNTNRSKFNARKGVPDSSLSMSSTARILNDAINNIAPLKRNTSTYTLIVNSSNPKNTLSIHENVICIPKFESPTSALLPINATTNSKTILMNNCNKQGKRYPVVIEKVKETAMLKPSNKAQIKTDSDSKRFEVSSLIPEHFVSKNKYEAYISKPLLYKSVESIEVKCARNFKSNTPSSEGSKRSTKKVLSKDTEKKIQTIGLGDGDKKTSQTHCKHDGKSDTKRKSVDSSKISRHQDINKSSKLKTREEGIIQPLCKTVGKK